jgi:hypothetical protein
MEQRRTILKLERFEHALTGSAHGPYR